MLQKIEFHKVRGVAEVINATFEFLKKNLQPLTKAILFISGPSILLAAILYAYLMYTIYSVLGSGRIAPVSAQYNPMYGYTFEFVLVIITIFVSFFLFYSVIYQYINLYINSSLEKIEVSDVWKAILKDFWLMFGTCLGLILVFFIVGIIFGLAAIVAVAIGGAVGLMTSPVVAMIFIIPLYVLLFYLLIPYSLIFNVRINERSPFFSSVFRCHELIYGNRLRTMGVILLSIILQFMLIFVLSIPNYVIGLLNTYTSIKINAEWLAIPLAGILLIASFAIGTLSVISINFQYFNLLERKQAPSMLNKINTLGGTQSTSASSHEETY